MKTDFFQSCGHCWVFQICWDTECSTFTASSFRIWNSSAGIPSLPLAFVHSDAKAHLTSRYRMSGSRWMITPLYLSVSLRSFLYSLLFSCNLFLISSVRSIPFLSFIVPIFVWHVPFVSLNFLKEISSLSYSVISLYFFALFTLGRLSYHSLLFFGILHSDGYIFAFLLCLSLLFFSQLFVRPQTSISLLELLSLGSGFDYCFL